MNYEDAVRKATKLLRLANSKNANESAAAAAAAQAIIDRYQIEQAAMEEYGEVKEEPVLDFWDDPLEVLGNRSMWKTRLARKVANHNACGLYLSGGSLKLVGRPSDVSAVRYLYSWIVKEVDRLTKRDTKGHGKSYANNYRLGVVDAVGTLLNEQKLQTEAVLRKEAGLDQFALVRVDTGIEKWNQKMAGTQEWMNSNMSLGKRTWGPSRYSGTARAHGRSAGREIKITKSRGSLEG